MTPEELRDQFKIKTGRKAVGFRGASNDYVEWIEQKVIDLTASLQFQQDMNALTVGPDVCPRSGSEDFEKWYEQYKQRNP